MVDSLRPYVPKGTHPIENGRYLIPTNMIFNVYEEVSKWIGNRTPGAILYGRPRLGKTKAIEYLRKLLPTEFGETIPIFHICSSDSITISENRFFGHLLEQVGHALYLTGSIQMKRDRLVKYLVNKAEMSGQKRLIIFIDDAQRLREKEYEWLMDIYNQLDRHNIYMTVILVGQEELIHQRVAFVHSKKAQIIGRFMVHEYKFSGIKGVEDIKNCLIGYDSGSEYPAESGWSFTRYYFPEAYDLGYRLEHDAEDLYDVFLTLRKEANLVKPFDIPMQYLTLTIEYALKNFGSNGKNVHQLTIANWREAIENSGYIKSELYQEDYDEVR